MSQMNTYRDYVVNEFRDIISYVIVPQYELCSRCNTYGHSRETSTCPMYVTARNYCLPTLRRKCSRCNQSGHSRTNRRKCSLFQQYPDKYAGEIREILANNNSFPDDTFQMNRIKKLITFSSQFVTVCLIIINTRFNNPLYTDQANHIINRCRYLKNDIISMISLFDVINVRDTTRTRLLFDVATRNMNELREMLTSLPAEMYRMIITRVHEDGTVFPLFASNSNVKTYPKICIVKSTETDITITSDKCSICFEDTHQSNACLTNCNHRFCVVCIQTYHKTLENKSEMPCPMCRTSIVNVTSSSNIIKF